MYRYSGLLVLSCNLILFSLDGVRWGKDRHIPGSYNQASYFTEKTRRKDSVLNTLLLYIGIYNV